MDLEESNKVRWKGAGVHCVSARRIHGMRFYLLMAVDKYQKDVVVCVSRSS